MANTYSQIHLHCVFAVKYRQSLIMREWKERLHMYITGIIQNLGHKMIAINSMPDHLHMFFGMRPNQSLSDLMRIVKGDSSEWLNAKSFTPHLFRWQEGYGAFSYEKKMIPVIANYIELQEQHHHQYTFKEEYRKLLEEFGVSFEEKYLFTDPS